MPGKLTTTVKWVSVTVLLLAVTGPFVANYRIPQGPVICLATLIIIWALLFAEQRIKTHGQHRLAVGHSSR